MVIKFKYKNWKGKTSDRTAEVKRIYKGTTKYHPEPQLLIEAFDYEKNEERTFAIRDILDIYSIQVFDSKGGVCTIWQDK